MLIKKRFYFKLEVIFIIMMSLTASFFGTNEFLSEFNSLQQEIRNGKIEGDEAAQRFFLYLPQLNDYFVKSGGTNLPKSPHVFPLEGYNPYIAGMKKSGFIYRKINFFSTNSFGEHPAYDLFIYDKNELSIDDRTGSPVHVLSYSYGIVAAAYTNWKYLNPIKGGNYILVYNPAEQRFYYYAHNKRVLVSIGDFVKPGSILAEVGRTGLFAYPKRSPTHLHFASYRVSGKRLIPVNTFYELRKAKIIK